MATATVERQTKEQPAVGEDGYPVRLINGVPYSTKPYPEDERPLYWNPLFPGQEMRWHDEEKRNVYGFPLIIQKEAWTDGKFRPRNDWEREMTRQWMMRSLDGCNDPDKWLGVDHPAGAGAEWRCECTWPCGNYHAFDAHLRYLKHKESREHY